MQSPSTRMTSGTSTSRETSEVRLSRVSPSLSLLSQIRTPSLTLLLVSSSLLSMEFSSDPSVSSSFSAHSLVSSVSYSPEITRNLRPENNQYLFSSAVAAGFVVSVNSESVHRPSSRDRRSISMHGRFVLSSSVFSLLLSNPFQYLSLCSDVSLLVS